MIGVRMDDINVTMPDALAGRSGRLSAGDNNLLYVCSLVEFVGRATKNRRGDVVKATQRK